jgi:hypothetical protein
MLTVCATISHNFAGESYRPASILKLLGYASNGTKEQGYFGTNYTAGYHGVGVGSLVINGQRDPKKRLAHVPYDFRGKRVIDFGTNTGGMLFAISQRIKFGVGFEYNTRAVNVANMLKMLNKSNNLMFYNFDLDNESFGMLRHLIPVEKVDICFMLSLAKWVKRWKDLVKFCVSISQALLFETHGSPSFQVAQIEYVKTFYKKIIKIPGGSDDDVKCRSRRLYLCLKVE